MEERQMTGDPSYDDFEAYLNISHYYAMRSACMEVDGMVRKVLGWRVA